jgi:hypothetical protein
VDAVPVIARGHNVAVLLPPITDALCPLLAAVPKRPILLIACDLARAASCVRAFGEPDSRVAGAGSRPAEPHPGSAPLVGVGAEDALDLLAASVLRPAAFGALVLAWPEELSPDGHDALSTVMAEADKDAQRVVVTADAGGATPSLIERYAFKAMTFGFPPVESEGRTAPGPVGPAHYVIVPEGSAAEWTYLVRDALGEKAATRRIARCPADRAAAEALAAGGPPVLLLAPHELRWARTLFHPLLPQPVPARVAGSERRAARVRREIAALAEAGDLDHELLVLAPLIERYDAAVVAAAALHLALARRGATTTAAAAAAGAGGSGAPGVPAWARLWVGVGRRDNARPGDLVGALVNEAKLPADAVGRIEVRDLFCLVEVSAEYAEQAVRSLTGITVRGRRLTARLDRGPGPGPHRPPRRV